MDKETIVKVVMRTGVFAPVAGQSSEATAKFYAERIAAELLTETAKRPLKLLLLERANTDTRATQRFISEDEAAKIISNDRDDRPTVEQAKAWLPGWFPNLYDFADSEITTRYADPAWTMIRLQ